MSRHRPCPRPHLLHTYPPPLPSASSRPHLNPKPLQHCPSPHPALPPPPPGLLSLPQGRTVSFKNCLILLTSNVGSRMIASSSGTSHLGAFMGRPQQAEQLEQEASYSRLRHLVMDEVRAFFKPELLNRCVCGGGGAVCGVCVLWVCGVYVCGGGGGGGSCGEGVCEWGRYADVC